MKIPNSVKWLLLWLGKLWAPKLIAALGSVDPDEVTDLKVAKEKLAYAVQKCDSSSGPLRVSGTLRGLIEKAINAAPDFATLAQVVGETTILLEKYA